MTRSRQLKWDGCSNVRDLGGLRTVDGRRTRWGAVVRSDDPSQLTAAGWESLFAYGIRTIISLQTDGMTEDIADAVPLPSGLTVVRVGIEDLSDTEFVEQWVDTDLWGTPLYYQDALIRWPERHARAVDAIAQAKNGGVLIHCRRGNDRTGIIAMLLLAVVGVPSDDIVKDYEMSLDSRREELLASRKTSSRKVILDTLASLDPDAYLLAGGMSRSDLKALRERLLEPSDR
jgi:protein-tyrosine phosphatase